MNVNAMNTQSINQMNNLSVIKSEQNIEKEIVLEQRDKSTEQGSISKTGQVASHIANLPEAEQQEVKSYLKSVSESKANGGFDKEASIQHAPQAFKDLSSQLSLDSEDALTVIFDKSQKSTEGLTNGQAKLTGTSAYAEVAQQTDANKGNSSIFDKFTSLFASDS